MRRAFPIGIAAVLPAAVAVASLAAGDVQKGNKVFRGMQCFTCHPGGGNIMNPSKPIKGQAFFSRFPRDQQIAEIIRDGVPGTAMPAYSKGKLSDDELSDLIAYVRSFTPVARACGHVRSPG